MSLSAEVEELLHTPLCFLAEDELEEAFYILTNVLEVLPEEKRRFKSTLEGILARWGRLLEQSGQFDKLFSCYHKALTVFCDHEGILSNLGAHLLRAGHMEKASEYFQEALKVNNNYLPARRNLETVRSFLVERWHFRMLNDNIRNSCFREAIIKKVKKGFNCVLDIGTGTGILSLFALEGGAQEIYACDYSKTMIDISKQVFHSNNATDKIKLINKMSNVLKIPDDLPKRVSLVITETVDIGLLGENILQTLLYAWDNLLLPCSSDVEKGSCSSSVKTGCVIPHSANVWVAAVECPYIGLKHRVLGHQSNQEGTEFDCRDFIKLNLFTSDGCEYDSMELAKVPEGFRFLTQPTEIININFNDRNRMEQLIKGSTGKREMKLICTGEGHIDAVAMWFDLKLDEDIVLSSAPMDVINRAKCWDQAIFPSQIPISVTKNQSLRLEVGCQGGRVSVKLLTELIHQTSSSGHKDVPVNTNPVSRFIRGLRNYPVSKDIVSFCNDKYWIDSLNQLFKLFVRTDIARNSTDILDISPFPLFGLAFLINQQKCYGRCRVTLTCVANKEQDRMAIMSIARANNISYDHLEIVQGEIDDILSPAPKFDLILALPMEISGRLHEKNITYLPFFNLIKKPSGMITPIEMKICSQLIYSEWLNEVSCVQGNERVCGYDIAPLINKYKVSEHLDISLSTLQYDVYSEIIETPAVPMEQLMSNLVEPWTCQLFASIKKDGVINALPYWFKIKLFHNVSEVSTYSPTSFANQAAVLLEPQLNVKAGDSICVTFTCYQGLMNAMIKKVE